MQILNEIRDESRAGVLYLAATEMLASLLSEGGEYQKAYDLLYPQRSKIKAESLHLLHQLAYHVGNMQEAIQLGTKSFQSYPSYDTALVNAWCHARLGEERPAVGWLQSAIREGLPNVKEAFAHSDFDKIRGSREFQELESSFS